jgi:hypothetical protein
MPPLEIIAGKNIHYKITMENTNKPLYLEEDLDIIERMDKVSAPNGPGQVTEQQYTMARVAVEATLRNRKSLENFSSTTTRLTMILIALGLIQVVAMVFQFLIMISDIKYPWVGLGFFVAFVVYAVYIIKKLVPKN